MGHEFEIRKQNPDCYVMRKNLTEIAEQGKLVGDDSRLFVDGQEVAVVYFRCGYTPDQYPSEVEWSARLMLERSLAIKCPSIHYHLAGTKKIQQRLAEKGMLEYFFPGPENAAKVEKTRPVCCEASARGWWQQHLRCRHTSLPQNNCWDPRARRLHCDGHDLPSRLHKLHDPSTHQGPHARQDNQ